MQNAYTLVKENHVEPSWEPKTWTWLPEMSFFIVQFTVQRLQPWLPKNLRPIITWVVNNRIWVVSSSEVSCWSSSTLVVEQKNKHIGCIFLKTLASSAGNSLCWETRTDGSQTGTGQKRDCDPAKKDKGEREKKASFFSRNLSSPVFLYTSPSFSLPPCYHSNLNIKD